MGVKDPRDRGPEDQEVTNRVQSQVDIPVEENDTDAGEGNV